MARVWADASELVASMRGVISWCFFGARGLELRGEMRMLVEQSAVLRTPFALQYVMEPASAALFMEATWRSL